MNGIGLISTVILSVALSLMPFGASTHNSVAVWVSVPFLVVGFIGLVDDLVLKERIIKKILRVK